VAALQVAVWRNILVCKRTKNSFLVNNIPFINRLGAEEARGAHNSEVVRSKRTAGIQ
jgi:hypothetical protein